MILLERFLESERKELMDNNIRLNAIGQIDRLPETVRKALQRIMALTEQNDSMLLNLALSYGSRDEIIRMAQALARKAKAGQLDPDAITSELVSEHLYTRDMPDPDLLIRTSGEMRISNFLLWQIAYTEIYVTDTLWPDFGKDEFVQILDNFQQRERRFGKV
jgi:undecaprenyl diphosphate synthase